MKQRYRVMHNENDLITSDSKDKNINSSEIQLHRMQTQDRYIEAQVQEGDTLQALALRFYCSIPELKRINKIHKDNEIFARRTIKVPVTPYSVLTELATEDGSEPLSMDTMQNNNQPLSEDNEKSQSNSCMLDRAKGDEYTIDCNTIVMNSTLAPSVVPYVDIEPNESVGEDSKLLPDKGKSPVEAVVVKQLTSQGADLGMKWFQVFCCMLLLGVVVPVVYVLFYLQKEEHPTILHET